LPQQTCLANVRLPPIQVNPLSGPNQSSQPGLNCHARHEKSGALPIEIMSEWITFIVDEFDIQGWVLAQTGMDQLMIISVVALASFAVVWVANSLVGLLSGERPRDDARHWSDIFLRFFAILKLGFVGRILAYAGFQGWARRIVIYVGLFCLMLFLFRGGHANRQNSDRTYTTTINGTTVSVTQH
jgi:hypothetical protein